MMSQIDVLYYIQDNLTSPFFDVVFKFFTYLGGPVNIFFIVGILYFFLRNKRQEGLTILVSITLTAVIAVLILKRIINEPRPCDVDTSVLLLVKRPYGQSLPSGHAAVTAAGAYILFIYKDKWKWIGLFLTLIISYSRLYLFVHYPLDIFSGIIVGVLCAYFGNYLTKSIVKHNKKYFINE